MIRKTVLAAALAFAVPAYGIDGISFEAGRGEGVNVLRLGMQWNWERKWFAERSWNIVGYWDLTAGFWDTPIGANPGDLGLTPTFRLQQAAPGAIAPYFEAAIGFHLLSEVRVKSDKMFSTNFQFGDHVGAGARFGPRGRYDISVRLQHLSNGSIKEPNPGVNFAQLRLAYHFH